jgi:hypothetical protein
MASRVRACFWNTTMSWFSGRSLVHFSRFAPMVRFSNDFRMFDNLNNNPNLKKLIVFNAPLSDKACDSLAQWLSATSSLQELSVMPSTSSGTQVIWSALQNNKSVSEVNVVGLYSLDTIVFVQSTLLVNTTLTLVGVCDCRIHAQFMDMVLPCFSVASQVRQLFLVALELIDQDAISIARFLETNQTIQMMTLANNQITEMGATLMMESLSRNEATQINTIGTSSTSQ